MLAGPRLLVYVPGAGAGVTISPGESTVAIRQGHEHRIDEMRRALAMHAFKLASRKHRLRVTQSRTNQNMFQVEM